MSLKDDAHGKWAEILSAHDIDEKILSGKHTSCPFCPSGKKSNQVRFRFTDYYGDGNWICSYCGTGNGLELLIRLKKMTFEEAIKSVAEHLKRGLPALGKPKHPRLENMLEQLWEFGSGLIKTTEGDPVDLYLKSRALNLQPDYLRLHPSHTLWDDGQKIGDMPVMVALFQNHEGTPMGYHRTYLPGNGKRIRKVMGRGLSGSAIRLSPIQPVIGLAEGIETALSVTALTGIPCWAAYSKDNMRSFVPPEGVEKVKIFADTDESFAGQLAAVKAAHELHSRGVNVELQPFLASGDYNDKLMARRKYASVA